MDIVSRQGRVMWKTGLASETQRKIRKELTVRAHWDPNFGPPPPKFTVFLEDDSRFCLPTYWAQKEFGGSGRSSFRVTQCPHMVFAGALKADLRQDEAVASTLQTLQTVGRGILAVHTGGGKTAIALYIACHLKVQTLVVVHKQVLLEQWQERVRQFVPGAAIGMIQGQVFDVDGKDVVIAMLQTLSQKEFCLDGFGFCVVDECNHVAAPTFSQAMLQANCPHVLGLSATPERKDGLTRVLEWFMGPVFSRIEREDQRATAVRVVDFKCEDYAEAPPLTRMGKLNFSAVITALTEIEERNLVIVREIKALPSGRKALVLSDRRPHCMLLAEMLELEGVHAKVYLGGMHRNALQEAACASVICATFSIAAEGLDIPDLNTLVLATPKKDVVQACGRILRGGGTSVHPFIVDIRDWWKCLHGQFYGRKGFYSKAGYTLL